MPVLRGFVGAVDFEFHGRLFSPRRNPGAERFLVGHADDVVHARGLDAQPRTQWNLIPIEFAPHRLADEADRLAAQDLRRREIAAFAQVPFAAFQIRVGRAVNLGRVIAVAVHGDGLHSEFRHHLGEARNVALDCVDGRHLERHDRGRRAALLARNDEQHVIAQRTDIGGHALCRARAQSDHQDHGRHADDDPERR